MISGQIAPNLPSEMSVAGCVGVVLACHAITPVQNLRFECVWETPPPFCTGSDTGEGLDAHGWENKTHLLLIGTEDQDLLNARLPKAVLLSSDRSKYPIELTEGGLAICVEFIPAACNLSLHFLIAWNSRPESVECSCWYAVDIPHNRVQSELRLGQHETSVPCPALDSLRPDIG